MAFKKRSKTSLSLADKVDKMSKSESKQDEAEWRLTVDGQGNGGAVIRFLPHSLGEEYSPFVKTINHGFQSGKRWFIENCPTTLGLDCPVCTSNSEPKLIRISPVIESAKSHTGLIFLYLKTLAIQTLKTKYLNIDLVLKYYKKFKRILKETLI